MSASSSHKPPPPALFISENCTLISPVARVRKLCHPRLVFTLPFKPVNTKPCYVPPSKAASGLHRLSPFPPLFARPKVQVSLSSDWSPDPQSCPLIHSTPRDLLTSYIRLCHSPAEGLSVTYNCTQTPEPSLQDPSRPGANPISGPSVLQPS